VVGALGGHRTARVSAIGDVGVHDLDWTLGWWIGADDRWHVPEREVAVRQHLVDAMPVVETAMRVPGGDAVQRVYGVAGAGAPIVVEVENASGAPFVATFVVRGARSVRLAGPVEGAGAVVVDNRTTLVTARPPARWALERGRSTDVTVCSGAASEGAFPATRDRAARLEAAFLYPVAHRTRLRLVIVATDHADPALLEAAPSAEQAARGWRAHVERGMQAELPDERVSTAVATALADALLAVAGRQVTALDAAALEDWGFDAEAATAWSRLSGRERRRAAQRAPVPSTWDEVREALGSGGAELLVALRALLVHEHQEEITLLAELPAEWTGQPIEVHDAPTRRGPVSFAVRWHGERPALLWSAPPGITLRAPGVDPDWSTREPSGDALLRGATA
jgi:hypothetical protein